MAAAVTPVTLFPGNKIPANRINSICGQCHLPISAANLPGDPFTGANNYFSEVPAPYDGENYSTRSRSQYSGGIGFFARWSHNQGFPGRRRRGISAGESARLEGNNRAQTSIGISDAFIVNPSMVITAQAGYTRWTQEGTHPNFDPDTLGFSKSALSTRCSSSIFPQFNISDMYYIGTSEGQWFEHTNTYSFNIGVTKIAGSHNMKWGFQGQVKQNNSVGANRPAASTTSIAGSLSRTRSDRE